MPLTETSSRRQFILALSGSIAALSIATPSGALAATAAAPASIAQLSTLCNALAGTQVDNDELVRQYLSVLTSSLDKSQLQALLALASLPTQQQAAASLRKPVHEAAEFALQLWMSAMTRDDKVLAYMDAPVWSTLSFTKPPGACGGAFGYWADKPA